MPFSVFAERHARTLQAVFDEPDWQDLRAGGDLDRTSGEVSTPPKIENVFALPVEQLTAINEEKVRRLIAGGERDEERLLAELGTWPEVWPEDLPVRLSFLGISLTFRCDMQPKCVYCNQRPTAERMRLEDWRELLRSLAPASGLGPYVYFTGGEPLLLGEGLWGSEGLIEAAGEAGAACNVNTNALALTPQAAVGLVRAGLGRIHISLDTHRPEVEDTIHQCEGRWRQIVRGLYNLQIAKAVLGAEHPVIHLNCVLTRLNADDFPAFLRFLLEMKPLVAEGLSPDLDLHLIPVGGEQNRHLRLTAEEYGRFFTETWEAANAVWQEYQVERGVPEDKRGALQQKLPFLSPFHRVQQRGDLAEWAERAAEGLPASLALTSRCYVVPTQGFVLPDGAQYWCGGHAVARPQPVGNVLAHGVRENIQRSLSQVGSLPWEQCRSCPGATQAINQTVEARLRQAISEWLNPQQTAEAGPPPDEPAVE